MIFWRCYYHFIWTTKLRQPLITPRHEQIIYTFIREKTLQLGSEVLAINGTADHIHIAISLNPKISISDWVKLAKGGTSHEVNLQLPNNDRFQWQRGYGVLTVGAKALPIVLDYIQQQKLHHQNNTIQHYLERSSDD